MSAPLLLEPFTTESDLPFRFASDFCRFTSWEEPKPELAARFSAMSIISVYWSVCGKGDTIREDGELLLVVDGGAKYLAGN